MDNSTSTPPGIANHNALIISNNNNGKPPTMNTIPNELLLHILSKAPYYDLKFQIPFVSDRFEELINHTTKYGLLDVALFRDCPDPTTNPHDAKFTVHPLFEQMRFKVMARGQFQLHVRQPDSADAVAFRYVDDRFENAVSPAVSRLEMRIGDYPAVVVTAGIVGRGVLVLDVMRAFVQDLCIRDDGNGGLNRGAMEFGLGGFRWTGFKLTVKENGTVLLDSTKVASHGG